jgi:hypothetical protein
LTHQEGLVEERLPAMEYNVAISAAPEHIPLDSAGEEEILRTTFCSDQPYIKIMDYFTTLGNMERTIDLRNSEGSHEYIYR